MELNGTASDPFISIIGSLTDWLMGLAAAIVVVIIVYSGYKYIQSSIDGSETGKENFKNALVGFVIVVLAYAIVKTTIKVVGGIGE
ncbi:MAG: TrbC/VirB2 family protein [Patescibacteria group bacterium]|nr:TrbC/VirB2 family protein [Patescibacteria group bacterium]